MSTFTTEDRINAQSKPLAYDDIMLLIQKIKYGEPEVDQGQLLIKLARAVEKAHGIG